MLQRFRLIEINQSGPQVCVSVKGLKRGGGGLLIQLSTGLHVGAPDDWEEAERLTFP